MRTHKINGVVLNKTPLNEKDYIVTVFTREFGKTEAIAKGSRKIESKFTGFFEPTYFCEFEFYKSKSHFIITECNLCKNFGILRDDLKKAIIAMDILKIIKKNTYENTEKCENEPVYNLIEDSFIALSNTKSPIYLFLGFMIKFLLLQGLIPLSNNNYWEKVSLKTKNLIEYFSENSLSTVPVTSISKNDFNTVMKNLEYFMNY